MGSMHALIRALQSLLLIGFFGFALFAIATVLVHPDLLNKLAGFQLGLSPAGMFVIASGTLALTSFALTLRYLTHDSLRRRNRFASTHRLDQSAPGSGEIPPSFQAFADELQSARSRASSTSERALPISQVDRDAIAAQLANRLTRQIERETADAFQLTDQLKRARDALERQADQVAQHVKSYRLQSAWNLAAALAISVVVFLMIIWTSFNAKFVIGTPTPQSEHRQISVPESAGASAAGVSPSGASVLQPSVQPGTTIQSTTAAEVLMYYVPRISAAILLELLAAYFFGLYRTNLFQIQHAQEEQTRTALLEASMELAVRTGRPRLLVEVLQAIIRSQPNEVRGMPQFGRHRRGSHFEHAVIRQLLSIIGNGKP